MWGLKARCWRVEVTELWRKKARCWRVEVTEPRSVATYQREIGWIGEKRGRFPAAEVEEAERRSNVGHLPPAVWTQVRAAANERSMSLRGLAVAAGEWAPGARGHNPHTPR